MVEVFKTNVDDQNQANKLLDLIHSKFENHKANFDLEDRDRILRIACENCEIRSSEVIALLSAAGFDAEVLQEEEVADFGFRISDLGFRSRT